MAAIFAVKKADGLKSPNIHEMFLQEKRVLKGWFPENPKRRQYYEKSRKNAFSPWQAGEAS